MLLKIILDIGMKNSENAMVELLFIHTEFIQVIIRHAGKNISEQIVLFMMAMKYGAFHSIAVNSDNRKETHKYNEGLRHF